MTEVACYNTIKNTLSDTNKVIRNLRNVGTEISTEKIKLFEGEGTKDDEDASLRENRPNGSDSASSDASNVLNPVLNDRYLEGMQYLVNLKRSSRESFLLTKNIDEKMVAANVWFTPTLAVFDTGWDGIGEPWGVLRTWYRDLAAWQCHAISESRYCPTMRATRSWKISPWHR